jgi:hypothetical protein
MWLSFSKGFLSVVATRDDPNTVMVRARRKEHLEAYFSTHSIIYTKQADYPYRVICSKAALTAVLVRYVEQLDYPNFKSSVKDKALHDAYMATWARMTQLEETNHWQRQREPVHNPVQSGGKNHASGKPWVPKVGLDHKTKRRHHCHVCDSWVTKHDQEMLCSSFDCPAA